MSTPTMHVLDTLSARGFVNQCTDWEGLKKHLDEPRTFYIGFDPTADSLHVGSLVQLMIMSHLSRAGHHAIAIVGGGTAKVGDPTGRDSVREIMDDERLERNKRGISAQIAKFCDGKMVDNADWLDGLGYITLLREIGRHFSINDMLRAESVKQRLDRQHGLSFIEFNYVLLQSYDYLELYRRHGCTLQVGGGDQWYNIVSGMDLIRRIESGTSFGLTTPLLTTASGAKMGKTAAGAVWLDPAKVSPYDYYQYWYNVDDRDIAKFLRLFTWLPLDEIETLAAGDFRDAKRVLAREATAVLHGQEAALHAESAAIAAFSGAVSADMPTVHLALPATLIDVLVKAGFAGSNSEARRLIQGGGVSIGKTKISDIKAMVEAPEVVWAGKKRAVRVENGPNA